MSFQTQYDNLFFDLDGTLLDTSKGFTASVAKALDRLGITYPSVQSLSQYMGPPLKLTLMHRFGQSEEQALEGIQAFRENMAAGAAVDAVEFAGMPELLADAKKEYKLFVTTSKPQHLTDMVITHFGYDQYFEGVIGSGMDHTRLTKHELIEYCMQTHALEPSRCLMIGDRNVDIIGAQQAGIDSIGVGYGGALPEEWDEYKPTYFVETVQDLRKLVLG